ncbi:hypothetical protein, partial [Bifidobacterium mellis]|uniref:hypothetical protein n=1 Tax=Bifidobacterium mellis TaxID=1293823 RepID=UPI001E5B6FD6
LRAELSARKHQTANTFLHFKTILRRYALSIIFCDASLALGRNTILDITFFLYLPGLSFRMHQW